MEVSETRLDVAIIAVLCLGAMLSISMCDTNILKLKI